jgi:hypothetical protein
VAYISHKDTYQRMKKQEPETILEVLTRERGEQNSEKDLN